MARDTVLITGATGHLGFHVLQYALDNGLAVRAAVRSQNKADILKSHITLQGREKEGQLDFVVVPDFGAPGAFDDAVKAVTYIIHCASPIPMCATDYRLCRDGVHHACSTEHAGHLGVCQ